MSKNYTGLEIAIVGMSGRFPGSKNVKELWKNICDGKNLISHFSDEELIENGVNSEYLTESNYVKAKGVIENAEMFDADLFGFFPKEVEMLDPQQRMFLECTWEALEDAGYPPNSIKELAGVFGGVGMNTYILQFLNSQEDFITSAEGYQLSIGNDKDFLTTRVSYKLDLRGPSLDVQTACSTSLVATHLACMNLINYQCDLAIAGGSTIGFPQKNGYHYQEGMILSPDGFCRPFDKDASGTVASNGTGVVVLKRLEDAIEDKDDIYAVVKGSAYNNDGSVKVGYTAPSVEGQRDVITTAYTMADVPMETVGYIETHGTGTNLGDPIEVEALKDAFNQQTDKKQFCAIGSIKSNIGHLDTAAGVTGLIKAALSIYHSKIPPSINYKEPNPKINFVDSPFFVNTKLSDWNGGVIKRAGVSSFGIGGTNAHVVLEEAPKKNKTPNNNRWQIIPISAKNINSLNEYESKLNYHLQSNSNCNYDEIAYTLQTGRENYEFRKAFIFENDSQIKSLTKSKAVFNNGKIIENPSLVFMFSGQGSQYVNMTRELYNTEENYRKYVNECFDILSEQFNLDIREIIFPKSNDVEETAELLKQTEFTQPALFVIEYSLAKYLINLGIKPSYMVGHSIGEFVAACLANVIDLESALSLVVRRGALMQTLEKGSMISVTLSEGKLREILPDTLDIAVINSPELCVVSGTKKDIIEFEKFLNQKQISNALLKTSHAFHSRMMEPALDDFKKTFDNIKLNSPEIPYMSNVTGEFITAEEATSPNYYVNHLRYTVRFSENMSNLFDKTNSIFIEVGPGTTLTSLAKLNDNYKDHVVVNSVRHVNQDENDNNVFLSCASTLWANGFDIDWSKFYDENPYRTHLPTYAFNRKRYWLNVKASNGKKKSNSSIFYSTDWKRRDSIEFENGKIDNQDVLVFESKDYPIEFQNASRIIKVYNKNEYQFINENEIHCNKDSFENLIVTLEQNNIIAKHIIFNWSTDTFFNLVELVKKLANIKNDIKLSIILHNSFDILGNEEIISEYSTVIGLAKVIEQEYANITTKIIEIDRSEFSKLNQKKFQKELFDFENDVVSMRNNYSWIRKFGENELKNSTDLISENGVYFLTGGLGNIGLLLAETLFEISPKIKVILADNNQFPNENEWDDLLQKESPLQNKISTLKKFKDNKYSFEILQLDITNLREVDNTFSSLKEKYEEINGVFHLAGFTGENAAQLINQFEERNYELQAGPKIKGLENVYNSTKDINLDFLIVQSSLASILGGVGFSSYSAVNNYVDSQITKYNKSKINNTHYVSLNWDAWNFSKDLKLKAITPAQGKVIFRKLFKSRLHERMFISLSDLNEKISELRKREKIVEYDEDNENKLHERPELDVEYLAPQTDLEKEIHDEWKKLLGIEKIGVNDNFFDLGGNSLIGTQLVSRMRKTFNVEVPLVAVFENATISGIAKLITQNKPDSEDSKKMNDILDLITNMSDEEAEGLLKDKE